MPHKRAKFSERQKTAASRGHDLAPPSGSAYLRDMPKGAMRILNAAKVQEEYHARKRAAKAEAEGASAVSTKGSNGKSKPSASRNTDHAAASASSSADTSSEPLKIKPGEKMGDFSRRVEVAMAGEIHTTMRAANDSSTSQKRKRRAERNQKLEEEEKRKDEQASDVKRAAAKGKAKQEPGRQALKEERLRLEGQHHANTQQTQDRDWVKASQRRRVNDVVQAPPKLTKAPRGESDAALLRKAQLKAALSGQDASAAAQKLSKKARLPDPVAQSRTSDGGLRRKAVLDDERARAIKLYREAKEEKLRAR